MLNKINRGLFIIQLTLISWTFALVLKVIGLEGADRAQDVFSLFPLLIGFAISAVSLFVLIIAFVMKNKAKGAHVTRTFFWFAVSNIFLPAVAFMVFMKVIKATY